MCAVKIDKTVYGVLQREGTNACAPGILFYWSAVFKRRLHPISMGRTFERNAPLIIYHKIEQQKKKSICCRLKASISFNTFRHIRAYIDSMDALWWYHGGLSHTWSAVLRSKSSNSCGLLLSGNNCHSLWMLSCNLKPNKNPDNVTQSGLLKFVSLISNINI